MQLSNFAEILLQSELMGNDVVGADVTTCVLGEKRSASTDWLATLKPMGMSFNVRLTARASVSSGDVEVPRAKKNEPGSTPPTWVANATPPMPPATEATSTAITTTRVPMRRCLETT